MDDARDPLTTPAPTPAEPDPGINLPPIPGATASESDHHGMTDTDASNATFFKPWVKASIMIAVLLVWAVYMGVTLLQHSVPPIALWSVPGATYTLLLGKLPKFGTSSGKGDA